MEMMAPGPGRDLGEGGTVHRIATLRQLIGQKG